MIFYNNLHSSTKPMLMSLGNSVFKPFFTANTILLPIFESSRISPKSFLNALSPKVTEVRHWLPFQHTAGTSEQMRKKPSSTMRCDVSFMALYSISGGMPPSFQKSYSFPNKVCISRWAGNGNFSWVAAINFAAHWRNNSLFLFTLNSLTDPVFKAIEKLMKGYLIKKACLRLATECRLNTHKKGKSMIDKQMSLVNLTFLQRAYV